VAVLVSLALLLGGVVAASIWLANDVASSLQSIPDPFPAVRPSDPRPSADTGTTGDPVNILLLGSDSRSSSGDPGAWTYGGQRSDVIMLLHIPGDRQAAYVISIPRDSWVDIPGHGSAKINAAYSYGGMPLMIQTLESRTGIRIDHVAIADFESFADLTDALGGVQITIPQDTYANGELTFRAGTQTLSGEEALAYARQRYGLPDGDFDRMRRQQNWIRAIAERAVDNEVLTSPRSLMRLVRTVSQSVAVDPGFSLKEMASLGWSLRDVPPGNVTFLTLPTEGVGRSPDGKQSIVRLDNDAVDGLARAIVDDDMADFVAENADELSILGQSVR